MIRSGSMRRRLGSGVWGISSWIGHGWCDGAAEKRPNLQNGNGTGIGVQMQRTTLPVERDQMPAISDRNGGQGIQSQRDALPVEDKRPRCNERGGQGVQAQREQIPGDQMPSVDHQGGGQGVQQQRVGRAGGS